MRRGRYSPVGLLGPQRDVCGTHGGAGWRQGGSPSEPEARTVLPCRTPFPAAGRLMAQGGAKGAPPRNLRRGTPLWDSFSRGGTHGGARTPFPAAGRMVAQGGAKGAPPRNLRRGQYSPVGLLFPGQVAEVDPREVSPRGEHMPARRSTAVQSTAQHSAAQHSTAQCGTEQHRTATAAPPAGAKAPVR
eukprot:gene16851-biopygen348